MKKLVIALVLVAGISVVGFAAFTKAKDKTEKKTEKKERKKECCKHTCPFS